jgi:hypothetical protein
MGARAMLYIVEVPIGAESERFIYEMGQMRIWLDHKHCQPIAFRQLRGRLVYRVDFTEEAQAKDFAATFSGRLRSDSAT